MDLSFHIDGAEERLAATLLEYLAGDTETLQGIAANCITMQGKGLIELELELDSMLLLDFDACLGNLLLRNPSAFARLASAAIEAWARDSSLLCPFASRLVVCVELLDVPRDVAEVQYDKRCTTMGMTEVAGRVAAISLPASFVASVEWRCPMRCNDDVDYEVQGFPHRASARRCRVCHVGFVEDPTTRDMQPLQVAKIQLARTDRHFEAAPRSIAVVIRGEWVRKGERSVVSTFSCSCRPFRAVIGGWPPTLRSRIVVGNAPTSPSPWT